jgi:hypothetical protein
MEPAVDEHAAVAGGEDKTVAIQPAGGIGVVDKGVAIENGADLGAAKRKAEMAGIALMDGVHGEAAGLVGSESEDIGLEFHALKWVLSERKITN